jgi:hypothetical protein
MKCPWYKLQDLNNELLKNNNLPKQHISIVKQLINYHQFRITRLFTGQGEVFKEAEKICFEKFYGAVDVSFLTLY